MQVFSWLSLQLSRLQLIHDIYGKQWRTNKNNITQEKCGVTFLCYKGPKYSSRLSLYHRTARGVWFSKYSEQESTIWYLRDAKVFEITSIFWFFIIVSFRTWQKVCRSGFLRTIIQLACIFWNDVIKALTSDVTLTSLGTLKRECRL